MVVDFAKINVKEQPVLILQNLDDTPIGVLKYAFNVEADLCYNEISTLTFDLPAYVDHKLTENYSRVAGMRIVDLRNYGRFLLVDPKVEDDGIKALKSCTAYSLEYEFSFKKLSLTEGTYNLWNPIAPKGTILGMIVELMPSWSVGAVDASLVDKYRTFDDSGDQNIYNFMKSDLQESYGCIFYFDTYKRLIHVRDVTNNAPITPVYFSVKNLVKNVNIDEDSESIVTNLSVYGADGVDIRSVNPMGTSSIIDLGYFMTLDNFSQSMIDKYNNWKQTFEAYQQQYYNLTIEEALKTAQLVTEQAALVTLQGEMTSLENIQAVIIQGIAQGLKTQSDLNSVNTQINAKKAEITQKQSEIDAISAEAAELNEQMVAINRKTALSAFFTEDEYKIVNRYLKEDSISEDSFVIPTVATYDTSSESVKISGAIFNVSRSEVVKVKNDFGKDIYSASGGVLECSTDGFVLQADLIRASLDFDSDKNILFTARVNNGTLNGTEFPNACVSISGMAIVVSSNVKADTEVGGAVSAGSTLQFKINSANLYFTRSTTEYEQRTVEWDLFEYGKEVLEKVSQPSYTFSLDLANFLAMTEFQYFKDNLALGSKVYWQNRDDRVLQPILIGVHIPFDDLEKFEVTLSSKYTSSDASFTYADLLEDSVTAGNMLDSGKWTYSQFVNSGAETSLSKFMKSALDIAKNNIMSSSGQDISWSESGFRLRKRVDGSATEYEPYQIWMNNGSIMFTTDNWQTANLAIGQMVSEDGTLISGVIADSLIGKLIAGSSLIIESAKKDGKTAVFRVDGSGASLHNAIFDLYNANQVQITLNPYSGIAIGKYPLYSGDEYTINESNAKFWVDTSGNVHIKGKLEGCDGTFSGKLSAASGTFIGELSAATGNFKGVVQASDFLDASGKSMLTSDKGKFDSNYLDLGNIQIDGTTGNITMTGSINLQGNITWGSGSSPVRVLYGRSSYSTPTSAYSAYPSSSTTGWHKTLNTAYDYYASYSYDGGATWTSAMQIQGVDGTNGRDGVDGSDGSDADVTRGNIARALYENSSDYYKDGIYSYKSGSKYYLAINASYILAGNIDADNIALTCDYGGFCKGHGYDGQSTTYGSMMYGRNGAGETPYIIVTNAGARITSDSADLTVGNKIWLSEEPTISSDSRVKNSVNYTLDAYKAFFMALKPATFKYNYGTSGREHLGFIAQDVEQAMLDAGLSSEQLAALVKDPVKEVLDDGIADYRYSIRYGELIALNTYMTQTLYRRIEVLEKELQALKEG